MPRRIDLDARKAQLAEAVWQVIRHRGIGAVSVRSVAEQAGVAVGSLRHVFPTRAELLEFSAELMVQRATDRIRAIPQVENQQQYAMEVVRQLLPLGPESRAEMEVNLALIAESPALPSLLGIRNHAYRQLAEACIHLAELVAGRPCDSRIIQQAQRLHAIIDGLAMHLLMEPRAEDASWAMEIVRDELARLAGGASSRSGSLKP